MKKIYILLLCFSVFTSCKNDIKKSEQADQDITTLSGEYIYFKDAAVLQSGNNVYGVVINDKAKELYEKGKDFRQSPTDGIQVQVRGVMMPKKEGEDGWPFIIDIKEIEVVKALDAKKNEVIKIGK